MNIQIDVHGQGQGLYEVTDSVNAALSETSLSDGVVNVFIRHTSASLIIQENADPAVLRDLEQFINQLVPENDPAYTHTQEGPDDMPAHIKSALTQTSLTIPVTDGQLALGTWQGLYVWEHRHARHQRQLLISVLANYSQSPASH